MEINDLPAHVNYQQFNGDAYKKSACDRQKRAIIIILEESEEIFLIH